MDRRSEAAARTAAPTRRKRHSPVIWPAADAGRATGVGSRRFAWCRRRGGSLALLSGRRREISGVGGGCGWPGPTGCGWWAAGGGRSEAGDEGVDRIAPEALGVGGRWVAA